MRELTISEQNRNESYVQSLATIPVQKERYFRWLSEAGPSTDHDAVEQTGIMTSSVCALRNALIKEGRVRSVGSIVGGPFKRKLTLWAVTA